MFDISSIKDALSAPNDIKHPITGAQIGATVTLAGPEHPTRKAIDFAKQRKLRSAIQKSGKLELTDPADDELDAIEKLASCTLGWSGLTDGGSTVDFTAAAALQLYSTDGMGWLRAQLLTAMDERERFISACATS